MPKVAIKDMKQYEKALEVLTRVGTTFQGVGQDEWFLLVTEAQYRALLEAKVIAGENGAPEEKRGKTAKEKTQL
jgi:hypothetical protein